jgi:hypothetical protein
MKVKLYYTSSFKFQFHSLSGRLRIKIIYGNENTRRSRMTPCPRDADLKNGSRQERERESTSAKQHQNKA